MKRIHRNPKLNPGWEVGVKKGFFEEITERRRLSNSQVKCGEGGTCKKTCVRAIGQEGVWPVPEASEAMRETWTGTWRATVGSVALILRATEGSRSTGGGLWKF